MEGVVELKINYLNDKFHELLRLKSFASFGSGNLQQYGAKLKSDLNSIVSSLELELCAEYVDDSLLKFNGKIINREYASNTELIGLLESLEKLKSVILNEIEAIFDEHKQASFWDSVYTSQCGSFTNELTISRAWSPFLVDKSPLLGFEQEIEYSDGSNDESSFDESSIRVAGTPLKSNDRCSSKPNTCESRLIDIRRNSKSSRQAMGKAFVAFKQEGANRWSFLAVENIDNSDSKTDSKELIINKENEITTPNQYKCNNVHRYKEKKTKIIKSVHYGLTHH